MLLKAVNMICVVCGVALSLQCLDGADMLFWPLWFVLGSMWAIGCSGIMGTFGKYIPRYLGYSWYIFQEIYPWLVDTWLVC